MNGPGSEGLSLRQTYTVTMVKNGKVDRPDGRKTLYAVPSNVGPQTMPNYNGLFRQGSTASATTFGCSPERWTIRSTSIWARHSIPLNFRMGVGGVLSPSVDADDTHNYAPDSVAGYNVNTIVLEVPITMLTVGRQAAWCRRKRSRDRHLRSDSRVRR